MTRNSTRRCVPFRSFCFGVAVGPLSAICLLPFLPACAEESAAADWTQAGANPQHTHFVAQSIKPPYEALWRADFSPECIFSAQPVVSGDRLFATTLNGNVYALDVKTGERQWHFDAGDVIWSGPAAGTAEHGGAGLIFVASWEGIVYGLAAATGTEQWRHDAGEPISGAPCLAEETLFIGTRRGTMLAVGTDGALKWKQPLSWHVYSTAAWNAGRLYVVTEDMIVHGLDAATGKEVWTSEKLYGLTHREFYPVIYQGKVLVSVTPAVYHSQGPGMEIQYFGWEKTPDELAERCRRLNREGKMPEEMEAAQQDIIRFYTENPAYQTFYVLNESDGRQAFVAVHHYSGGGLENLMMPPTVAGNGKLIMRCDGFAGRERLVQYDLERNRWTDMMLWSRTEPNDNAEYNAAAANCVVSKGFFHGDVVLDLEAREVVPLGAARVPLRHISVMSDYWEVSTPFSGDRMGRSDEHPTGNNGVFPPIISGKRIFLMNRVQELIAYQGQ